MECKRFKWICSRVDMILRGVFVFFLLTFFFMAWVVMLPPASIYHHFCKTGKNHSIKPLQEDPNDEEWS